jgi:hypothetical protein
MMGDKHVKDDPVEDASALPSDVAGEDDTEGHLMMPNIAAARGMTNERVSAAERNSRIRIRKDERPGDKRQR